MPAASIVARVDHTEHGARSAMEDLTLALITLTSFVLLFVLVSVALTWMHVAVRHMERAAANRGQAGQVPELPEMQGFGEPGLTPPPRRAAPGARPPVPPARPTRRATMGRR